MRKDSVCDIHLDDETFELNDSNKLVLLCVLLMKIECEKKVVRGLSARARIKRCQLCAFFFVLKIGVSKGQTF